MSFFEFAVSDQDFLEEGLIHEPPVVVLGFHVGFLAVPRQLDRQFQKFLTVLGLTVKGFELIFRQADFIYQPLDRKSVV